MYFWASQIDIVNETILQTYSDANLAGDNYHESTLECAYGGKQRNDSLSSNSISCFFSGKLSFYSSTQFTISHHQRPFYPNLLIANVVLFSYDSSISSILCLHSDL